MEIKKENVIAAYNSAKESGDDRTCTMLEQLFGIETFRPIGRGCGRRLSPLL